MKRSLDLRRHRLSETDGMAVVEFAIILSVFLMMLLGIIEFGYDWYLKHALTNASRDGARYGVMYRADTGSGNRILPVNASPSIENTVKSALNGELPSAIASTVNVTCSGAAWTSASPLPGDPLSAFLRR